MADGEWDKYDTNTQKLRRGQMTMSITTDRLHPEGGLAYAQKKEQNPLIIITRCEKEKERIDNDDEQNYCMPCYELSLIGDVARVYMQCVVLSDVLREGWRGMHNRGRTGNAIRKRGV